jgi:GH15 family glucan-1,4-alpha-glucosidase
MRAAAPARLASLGERSVAVIRSGQADTGAYIACPTFEPYRFAWLRDGSFVADAMSRVGEVESAEAFFDWAARVILSRRHRVAAGEHLHARYTVDGRESQAEWPTFQLDGYGMLLWALREHGGRHGRALARWGDAADVTTDYLAARWRDACTDWWEEREGVHAATLAAVYAGLAAFDRSEAAEVRDAVRPEEARLDASLLACATPFAAVDPAGLGPVLARIESELVSPGGGVHRHPGDTYYGGGEWLLLTALLGWCYAELGRVDDARDALDWVAAHATPEGELPEQSQDYLLAPAMYEPWLERWGPPACPLLWSHAMFLTLASVLGERG